MMATSVEPPAHSFEITRRGDSSADRLPGKMKTAPGGSERCWKHRSEPRSQGLPLTAATGKGVS